VIRLLLLLELTASATLAQVSKRTPSSQSSSAKVTSTEDPAPGSDKDLPCPQGGKWTERLPVRFEWLVAA
jgi:hypothetical protein